MNIDPSYKLKAFMAMRNLNVEQVAYKTGISIETVKNIFYGRSKKKEYFSKIAEAYELPLTYFTSPKSGTISPKEIEIASRLVVKVLEKKHVSEILTGVALSIFEATVKFILEGDFTEREIELYIEGNIDHALKFHLTK